MKRPLFVFAGQSNMMGAAVYEAREQIYYDNSFEYLHKVRRLGGDMGHFKDYGFPTGEFSYKDLSAAYGENAAADMKSELGTYAENTYFCPSMSNLESEENKSVYSFYHFSESNLRRSPSIAPYIIKGLEENGIYSAYAHIAKGGVPIRHYLSGDSEKYFYEKVKDFWRDCGVRFEGDDMSERILVWIQGESDKHVGTEAYVKDLDELWKRAKCAGFTRFFMIRVPYWGGDEIIDIMRAQEIFCEKTEDAYMLTRVCSFIPWKGLDTTSWQKDEPGDEYSYCRDSFYGFDNQHINEKGFKLTAKHAVPNIIRILNGLDVVLEEERVKALI